MIAGSTRSTPQPGQSANEGSVVPDIADIRSLSLDDGRRFPTKVAGLFLFLPLLLDLDLPQAVIQAGLPGSVPIPPQLRRCLPSAEKQWTWALP